MKRPGKQVVQPPDGRLRRSQAVTTFGPGAMIDLVDQAVLVGGLDFWGYGDAIPVVAEPRLREIISEQLKPIGVTLSEDRPFRLPPAGDDRDPSKAVGIQVLEFPQWFVCQNPSCRALVRRDVLEPKAGRYRHYCTGKKAFETVPVRFVAACKLGHLEDFPWIAFSHLTKGERCGSPQLKLEEGATGDFSEITVICACGGTNKLSAAMAKGFKLTCGGHRPWLGREGSEPCEEDLRLLVRTASNAYFSQVMSALSVPEPGRELEEKIQSVWDVLKVATPEAMPAFRLIPKVRLALEGHGDDEVLAVIRALQKGTAAARLPLRTAEFLQLMAAKPGVRGELPKADDTFFARSFKPKGGLPQGVGKLVLVSKLREVTAQVGFTRLEPITPDLQGELDLGVKSARLALNRDFLPATEVRGEGVFLALDEEAVRAWEARPKVKAREDELRAGFIDWAKGMDPQPAFPGVRFYLLHSLAHLLITAISLECGYAASAIRERIYAGPSARDPSTSMAAILLSTGTSGTEGTLGGLVEEGRKIRSHLQRAYDLGRLCSNDPVCAAHSPHEDRAERFLEGAACHGCLFIAECSCERFNRYLDRALVIPTVGRDHEVAFFQKRP